nr:zinc finger protein 728-like [Cherax quadricarinatus]
MVVFAVESGSSGDAPIQPTESQRATYGVLWVTGVSLEAICWLWKMVAEEGILCIGHLSMFFLSAETAHPSLDGPPLVPHLSDHDQYQITLSWLPLALPSNDRHNTYFAYTLCFRYHKKNNCEICGQPFTTKRALIRHCRIEHKTLPQNVTIDRKYKCEKCDRIFNRPSMLRHHLQLHGGVKPLECRLCNKQFSHRRSLRKHMSSTIHEHMLLTNNLQKDHAYDLKQNFAFVCEYCGIKLPTRHMLSKHSRLAHEVGIIWSCPHCEYKTKRNHVFERHMELHLESRLNFMCEVCGSSFHTLATLKDHHSFVHSDERNFKCSQCNKSFKNKSSLARHSRTHSDDRPYQCHCGASYKRLSHLKRHIFSAHNEILKSRAVKKFMRTEETKTIQNNLLTGKIQHVLQNFQMVKNLNLYLCLILLIPSNTNRNFSKKCFDVLLPAQESIILMGESSNSEQGHLIAVADSQIIQLIPSTFQFPQENTFSSSLSCFC